MLLTLRGMANELPPEEVPAWMESEQMGLYFAVFLVTIIVYDTRTPFSHLKSC